MFDEVKDYAHSKIVGANASYTLHYEVVKEKRNSQNIYLMTPSNQIYKGSLRK
jgi:hypothetical protein